MTRDSILWWFGIIGAVIVGLATLGNLNDYGIPDNWLPYIRLAALIVGIVSGKMATSPLPGKKDGGGAGVGSISTTGRILPMLLIGTLALGAATLPACRPHNAPILSPQGQIAYTADQIAVRVQELQRTAIQAEASGGLSTSTTRIINRFALTAAPILASTPDGWAATGAGAWALAKEALPPGTVTNPAVLAAINLVDIVLVAYMPPKGGAA